MKIVFLDAATMGSDLSNAPIAKQGSLVSYDMTAPQDVKSRIQDAEIVITNKVPLTGECMSEAKKLRLVCAAATGYDPIDIAWCRENGVGVCNVVGYSTESVVQSTFALALTLTNRMSVYAEYVASGAYSESNFGNLAFAPFHELAGKTWGIVGYGEIGSRVAEVARAFGCRVLTYTRTPKEGVENVTLDALCRQSDILSLHTPLTTETERLIGRKEIRLMKHGAILINVARGAVVDEETVAEATLAGLILYGCDVYSAEPPKVGHPMKRLFGCPNACMTPHIAWGSVEARERCITEIAENIAAFLSGARRNRIV